VIEARPTALVGRLRARPVLERTALPHPQRDRRRDQGVSRGDRRPVDLGPARGARTRRHRRPTRQSRPVDFPITAPITSNAMLAWAQHRWIAWRFIAPASRCRTKSSTRWPKRDELLNETILTAPARPGAMDGWVQPATPALGTRRLAISPQRVSRSFTATGRRRRNPAQLRRSPVVPPPL
jgi:hypothetical protein